MICPRCTSSNPRHQIYCGQCGTNLTETRTGFDTLQRVGQVLGGKYRLERLIGKGANGAVYRAEIEGLGSTVAIKVLHPEISSDEKARLRLENEARLASRINHPNIVSILDFHSSPELTYLVMEYLDGISLDEVLADLGHLSVRRAIHITRQLLAALEASHSLGVLHRDLKPDNIYLTEREDQLDFVKVLDFGLATLIHRVKEMRITVDGHVCGTPGYMSPEQVRNLELTDKTDLYGVGVVLYECLTGVNPFIGNCAADTMVNQITAIPEPPSKVSRENQIPLYLDALMMRALAKEMDDRFDSARDFRLVLEGLVMTQRRMTSPDDGDRQTCAECGTPLCEGAASCNACGEPVGDLPLSPPAGSDGTLTPEVISARASGDGEVFDELALSPTTTIRAYRGAGWDPPLVGRSLELELIDAMLVRDRPPGPARVLRILGGDGMGKGRLARESMKRARGLEWEVAWSEPEFHPSFAPLLPIQRTAARLLRAPDPVREEKVLLEAAARSRFSMEHRAGLLELFGLAERTSSATRERRLQRAQSWREVVRCAATRGPLQLVFMDVHLYDSPSQELVAALATDAVTDHPVNIVVTHDPQLLLLWPRTDILNVQALSSDEAKMLAATLMAELGLSHAPDQLIEASGGHPLLLTELIRLAAVAPSARPPRSLAEAINQRISRMPPKTRMLLHTMAVLGRPTRAETLATMVFDEASSEHRGLEFLIEQGFLLSSSGRYRPSHRMHREVAYASIPATLRFQLHSKAAEVLIRERGPSAHIAHHLYRAGEKKRAVSYTIRAGRRALYFLDDQRALKLFNRALQDIPAPPREFKNRRKYWVRATVGLARALHDSGDEAHAFRQLRQAAEKATAAGWDEQVTLLERQLERLRHPGTLAG